MTRKPFFAGFVFIINLLLFALSLAAQNGSAQPKPPAAPDSVTVPLIVEFNRPFVELEFPKPDGSIRKARFWVDTGGGAFILCGPLARDLNLTIKSVSSEGGESYGMIDPPEARVGGMALDLKDARADVMINKKTISEGVNAEGLLPGHVLMRYHVIFDYPGRRFTLAKPNFVKPRGTRLASPIFPRTGFPRIEATVGGETFGFLLDTGASHTMISQELLNQWAAEHADWNRVTGAVGSANMGLGPVEAKALMLRIPEFKLADLTLRGVAAVSRPKGTFENYMSSMMAAPIKGAIGGNVLSAFRVEIDYANGVTYLEKKADVNANDTDMVGLILRPQADGSYTVVAVSEKNTKEVTEAIRAGDKLIKIDKLEVANAPMAKVIDALRGKVNEKRVLVLERDGKQFTIPAPVQRVL